MTDDRESLDLLLDAALKSYVGQAPAPGMERRVLQRLPPVHRRRAWLRVSCAFAAVILVAAIWRPPLRTPVPARRVPYPVETASVREPDQPPVIPRTSPKSASRLSGAQRTLLRFVEADPDAARQLLGESRHDSLPSLEPAALVIEPLIIAELHSTEQTQ